MSKQSLGNLWIGVFKSALKDKEFADNFIGIPSRNSPNGAMPLF